MIKGWRNDPQWVAHYMMRDLARIGRQIESAKLEMHLRQLREASEDSIRTLAQKLPLKHPQDWR